MPPARAATTDREWDFSEFTEQVSLASDTEAPSIEYNGLHIVGAMTSERKDYVSSEGVHYNGATKTGQRYILFTPGTVGNLSVSYKSNGSSARGCYISLDASTGTAIASDSGTIGTFDADLRDGTTYYICCDAGITITNIRFSSF